MADNKLCECCRGLFRPRPQTPGQRYCGDPACQRERRRLWQRNKRQGDPDYRDNQRQAQRAWAKRHGSYWRAWRERNPEYCAGNRKRQGARDRRRRSARLLAKMDTSGGDLSVASGVYRLVPAVDGVLAKMDAWTVKIEVISRPSDAGVGSEGCLQREDVMGGEAAGG